MKAFVINLPRSRQRRASISEQLAGVELPYEFVDAVDGRELVPAERSRLVDEAMVERYPHWLTPGIIGCALSHLETYQRILAADLDVALVLEDDVLIPTDIVAQLEDIRPHMEGSEVVLLYFRSFTRCYFSARDAIALGGDRRLVYPMNVSQPMTTAAYLITREACRRLCDSILPVRAGPDSWDHFYETGAIDSIRCVLPHVVQVRKDFKSTMQYEGNASLRLRVTSFAAQHQLFPLAQIMAASRGRLERKMTRVGFAQERSPIASARGRLPT